MKNYKLDLGNSNTGQVGAVVYCKGESKQDALDRFVELVGNEHDAGDIDGQGTRLLVYFNPDLFTIDDVELVED